MAWRFYAIDATSLLDGVEVHEGRFHAGWNEAKSDANYSAMVSKRDHPLTPQGVAQARGLNDKWRRALSRDFGERPLPFLELDDSGYLGDKDDANCLEKVDVVWASPLDAGPCRRRLLDSTASRH